jgi:hypothetical protein
MESSSLQGAEAPPPAGDPSPDTPSNEVSIIPLNDALSDAIHDGTIIPSPTQSIKPSKEGVSKASYKASFRESSEPPQPAAPPARTPKAGQGTAASKADRPALKDALDAQLRAHLMEQLMPDGGRGPVTRLNVEMPEDLHQRLKQHCVKTRTPIKALINALIALYLEDEAEA